MRISTTSHGRERGLYVWIGRHMLGVLVGPGPYRSTHNRYLRTIGFKHVLFMYARTSR